MDGFKKMHQPSRAVGMPILQQNLPEAVIRSHRPHSAGSLFGQPRFPKTLNKQL